MISRQAILIGAPSVKPALPGVTKDVNEIKNFLKSQKGGVWREDEIIILLDKPRDAVIKCVESAKLKDYVFITCSGHGEHQIGKNIDETVMCLNEHETISINSINPQNKRHLVIVDVCRTIVKIQESSEVLSKASVMDSAIRKNDVDYRKRFDDAVMASSEGRIVAYSCDINQTAGDDGTGGYFTQELLKSPKYISQQSVSNGIVDISKAFDIAKAATYKKNAPQSPIFNAGRRRDFFPFAIIG